MYLLSPLLRLRQEEERREKIPWAWTCKLICLLDEFTVRPRSPSVGIEVVSDRAQGTFPSLSLARTQLQDPTQGSLVSYLLLLPGKRKKKEKI